MVGDDKEEDDKEENVNGDKEEDVNGDKEEDVNGDDKIRPISGIGWKIRFF